MQMTKTNQNKPNQVRGQMIKITCVHKRLRTSLHRNTFSPRGEWSWIRFGTANTSLLYCPGPNTRRASKAVLERSTHRTEVDVPLVEARARETHRDLRPRPALTLLFQGRSSKLRGQTSLTPGCRSSGVSERVLGSTSRPHSNASTCPTLCTAQITPSRTGYAAPTMPGLGGMRARWWGHMLWYGRGDVRTSPPALVSKRGEVAVGADPSTEYTTAAPAPGPERGGVRGTRIARTCGPSTRVRFQPQPRQGINAQCGFTTRRTAWWGLCSHAGRGTGTSARA